MKATLMFWHKDRRPEGVILELKAHEVAVTAEYPDGVRYRMICKSLLTGRFVLMDNHHPKGHHVHVDDQESEYHFRGLEPLVDDFKELVLIHLGVNV